MAGTATPIVIQHRPRGIVRTDISITCDASGVATATVVGVGYGRLVGVFYNGGLDISAVITLSDANTGSALVAYTTGTEGTPAAFRPTQIVTDNAGVALTPAATAPNVRRDIYLGGKVKIGVTAGGVSETATLSLLIDERGVGDLARN